MPLIKGIIKSFHTLAGFSVFHKKTHFKPVLGYIKAKDPKINLPIAK